MLEHIVNISKAHKSGRGPKCPSETEAVLLCRNNVERLKEHETAISGGGWAIQTVLEKHLGIRGVQLVRASCEGVSFLLAQCVREWRLK
jgi:hypothetical protein